MSDMAVEGATLEPFSLAQTVYMLSLGSNFLFEKSGGKQALDHLIQEYLGVPGGESGPFFQTLNTPSAAYQCLARAGASGPADWKTAWGPTVFKAALDPGATNTVFVAHSAALKTYVVAIAGTNPTGTSALERQDLDVWASRMVAWPPAQQEGKLVWSGAPFPGQQQAAISEGTSIGLSHIYGMEAKSLHSPEKAESLQAFLAAVASKDATLIFTGHSLGGALSPTLALLLYPTPGTSNWGTVQVLATAGPTPGNAALGALFSRAFPQRPIPSYPAPQHDGAALFTKWNVNYANSLDVVPRAWDELDGLLTPSSDPETHAWKSFFAGGASVAVPLALCLNPILEAAKTRAGYEHGPTTPYYAPLLNREPFDGIWGKWIPGTTYPPIWTGLKPPQKLSNVEQLTTWVLNAHLPQYSYAFLGANAPPGPQGRDGAPEL